MNLPYIPYEDWDPYFYFNVHMAKQNADGKWGAFEPQGADNGCVDAGTTVKTISNVDADGRARKIRVLYKNDYGICNTVDKIVQIPDLTPPQISGAVTASALSGATPQVQITFPRRFGCFRRQQIPRDLGQKERAQHQVQSAGSDDDLGYLQRAEQQLPSGEERSASPSKCGIPRTTFRVKSIPTGCRCPTIHRPAHRR